MSEKLKEFADHLEPPGDRRSRTWFDALKAELTQHANRLEARLNVFYGRALVAVAVLGLTCAVGLFGFGIVLNKQSDLTEEIQNQRFEAFVNNCVDTNKRHDKVIARIDAAVAGAPPKQRAQAQKGAKSFKLILEAAVPYTSDCVAYAKTRVKGRGR